MISAQWTPGEKWKKLLVSFCVRSGIAAVYVAVLFIVGRCPVKAVFGRPCPGCGITRACLLALQGELRAAFVAHPLWWSVPAVWLLIALDTQNAAPAWNLVRQGALAVVGLAFWARWLLVYIF